LAVGVTVNVSFESFSIKVKLTVSSPSDQ
jgi:hypothetical protein